MSSRRRERESPVLLGAKGMDLTVVPAREARLLLDYIAMSRILLHVFAPTVIT